MFFAFVLSAPSQASLETAGPPCVKNKPVDSFVLGYEVDHLFNQLLTAQVVNEMFKKLFKQVELPLFDGHRMVLDQGD